MEAFGGPVLAGRRDVPGKLAAHQVHALPDAVVAVVHPEPPPRPHRLLIGVVPGKGIDRDVRRHGHVEASAHDLVRRPLGIDDAGLILVACTHPHPPLGQGFATRSVIPIALANASRTSPGRSGTLRCIVSSSSRSIPTRSAPGRTSLWKSR